MEKKNTKSILEQISKSDWEILNSMSSNDLKEHINQLCYDDIKDDPSPMYSYERGEFEKMAKGLFAKATNLNGRHGFDKGMFRFRGETFKLKQEKRLKHINSEKFFHFEDTSQLFSIKGFYWHYLKEAFEDRAKIIRLIHKLKTASKGNRGKIESSLNIRIIRNKWCFLWLANCVLLGVPQEGAERIQFDSAKDFYFCENSKYVYISDSFFATNKTKDFRYIRLFEAGILLSLARGYSDIEMLVGDFCKMKDKFNSEITNIQQMEKKLYFKDFANAIGRCDVPQDLNSKLTILYIADGLATFLLSAIVAKLRFEENIGYYSINNTTLEFVAKNFYNSFFPHMLDITMKKKGFDISSDKKLEKVFTNKTTLFFVKQIKEYVNIEKLKKFKGKEVEVKLDDVQKIAHNFRKMFKRIENMYPQCRRVKLYDICCRQNLLKYAMDRTWERRNIFHWISSNDEKACKYFKIKVSEENKPTVDLEMDTDDLILTDSSDSYDVSNGNFDMSSLSGDSSDSLPSSPTESSLLLNYNELVKNQNNIPSKEQDNNQITTNFEKKINNRN